MKISARNVLRGTVSAVKAGAVNAEVHVDLGAGDQLTAIVTLASCTDLELAPGQPVVALVKAPWVIVMTGDSELKLSARNQLAGTVSAVETGAVNAEVVITLPGGAQIAAIVTKEAVKELGLAPGVAATAVIKASHVVLGVPKA
ncbi:TOBE domain-containing protein [Rubrivivax benzoatilyticus]|uniref:TOBE domain-containing protein n=1 Tax=Rubrivivax benzoatilyticus TaxID=316997 RepID=A0ABX0HRN0_9BURK|nr:TOBE domain-containing protein [Rubrivivax benzoatilyticus]EGJ11836.1 Mo processing, homeostasis [Rubrivivax benzoatilyticus JA2 = ATCC BAA-35]NHK96865.1 TOBE domain-containing protein [Rubrivivax benzoatilyticus]NHL24580.1 TOBE domain-containing protein [Rubrivivax benzoatilyticus]